ncbi:M16 family metallopeptidase [Providencia vermicola]|uniref:Insulinase family protein n=2 Tax=Providencia TaxID=586 RepID=A0AAI9HY12_PROST|nr:MULTISPECIES: insulinase family protein [Providencia]ELR5034714.1 insulinase family protein [Providencia stuartii]ELR5122417.1 insulinase family protein [Providencia stuartii]ELR5143682.1 insulinase family protein [Providencia stuartii]ELX8380099.1 insulinase family protein [Providencia stuartii]ELZ5940201.1 insulinase family protein [Providencia stuartii]
MQGSKIRYIFSVVLLSVAGFASAEPLQPDPAWQQGKLENGFSWQLLQTPQRPNDRIQLRLAIKAGSLSEKASEKGYSYLIPKMALLHQTEAFPAATLQNFWRQATDPDVPIPPAVVSYDYTIYSLSLPHNKPELLKQALNWLATSAAGATYTETSLHNGLTVTNAPVATLPLDATDPVWRARLKGSAMMGYDPGQKISDNVNLESVNAFYQKWYTPDVMTLYVAGHVDARMLSDYITQTFSSLEGKRSEPVSVAVLSQVKPQSIDILQDKQSKDSLSLIWDIDWQPINDSAVLLRYWGSDLAREALYRSLQKTFNQKFSQDEVSSNLDCRVQYQKASCTLTVNAPPEKMMAVADVVLNELSTVDQNGISPELFNEMINEKQVQLSQLFAAYARTSTDVLAGQRLISQQNGVVDIAPEQYQRLRQSFLAGQTLEQVNMEVRRLLSQEAAFVLTQPKDKQLMDAEQIRQKFTKVLWPQAEPASAVETEPTVATEPAKATQ